MTLRFPSLVVASLSLATAALSAEPVHVAITVNPPRVTRREFDPRHPPLLMPHLSAGEPGVCHYEFTIDASITCVIEQKDAHTVEARVDSIGATLDLPIDIWLGKKVAAKYRRHEEGHRQIAEDYYQRCGEIARGLAEKMIGRKVIGHGRDKAEAQGQAQQACMDEFINGYLAAARTPCRICEDHYDDLTRHGLKAIDESEAIARAKILQSSGQLPSTGKPNSDSVPVPAR